MGRPSVLQWAVTTQGNPKLTIRMDPDKREAFIARAGEAGTTGSQLILAFIGWWMGEPGARLPTPAARKETDHG